MKKFVFLTLFLFLFGCMKVTLNEKEDSKTFSIPSGYYLSTVADQLQKERFIDNANLFEWIGKIFFRKKTIKTGVYEIFPGDTYWSLLQKFTNGDTYKITITIPEGYNIYETAALLEQKLPWVQQEDYIKQALNPKYLENIGIDTSKFSSLEGFLFPSTYHIEYSLPVEKIILLQLKTFEKAFDKTWISQIQKQNLSFNNFITFASIVQKEAGVVEEMPKIASVYYNRLQKGMRLQADPTLIYALILDGKYTGNIKREHLYPPYPSSYNTYYTKGLPPGPITNPSIDALCAIINPEHTDYLYFVGKNDGTHYFSKNYEEHKRAVNVYQRGIGSL